MSRLWIPKRPLKCARCKRDWLTRSKNLFIICSNCGQRNLNIWCEKKYAELFFDISGETPSAARARLEKAKNRGDSE